MPIWRADLEGLPTEEYINTCARITAINYEGYLRFKLTNETFINQQAHRDWTAIIDRFLQSKHIGLRQTGKGLQRQWESNAYRHTDNMHWALQRRVQSAKLQSVELTGLVDVSVNKAMKRMIQDEL
ncbi:hypothetical protein BGZ79_001495, partial [Entomortierella chlamydospora]